MPAMAQPFAPQCATCPNQPVITNPGTPASETVGVSGNSENRLGPVTAIARSFPALIWATAKLNGVLTILTEDHPSSDLIEGVRFVNPLVQGFDLARLS